MGLFGLRKKHQKAQQQNENADIFSASGMIGYIKANLKNPTDENVLKAMSAIAEPDADQEHLTSDGKLPWGWLTQNTPICEPYEKQIVATAVALKQMPPTQKIAQLKKLIYLYYEYKNFCYSKNECFVKYFADRWEHCYNSRCEDFEYIAPYQAELKDLESRYEELLQQEQRAKDIKRSILPHLRTDLIRMIQAEPGILQVTICKHYPADMKPYITDELYKMEQEGLIIKAKEGRLNKFFLK